jgi:iron complex outermembrane receptor protein
LVIFDYVGSCASLARSQVSLTALAVSLVACGISSPALGAPPAEQSQPDAASDGGAASSSEILVIGTRLSDSVQTFPGSVSVVREGEIQKQLGTTRDIAQILSFAVPGIAPGNDTAANVDQSLRGRPMRLFIDGVSVSNPLRDGGRDVRLIAPTALGGIEVIRGSSALYGQGGAGGIVNYITKNGSAADDWAFRTEVGSSFSTEHFGDSMRPYVFQNASGGLGGFDINVNGSYERVNGQFDADGKRLPPDPNLFGGIADSDIYNFYGKIGYSFGGTQRIEAMANYYQQTQDTDYVVVPGDIAQGIPAGATKQVQDPRALDQRNRNFISYLAYTNSDILGSSLRSQIYYLKNYSAFGFEPARLGGTQTTIESEKYGLQTDFKTRLDGLGLERGLILWGFDINRRARVRPADAPDQLRRVRPGGPAPHRLVHAARGRPARSVPPEDRSLRRGSHRRCGRRRQAFLSCNPGQSGRYG